MVGSFRFSVVSRIFVFIMRVVYIFIEVSAKIRRCFIGFLVLIYVL